MASIIRLDSHAVSEACPAFGGQRAPAFQIIEQRRVVETKILIIEQDPSLESLIGHYPSQFLRLTNELLLVT